MAIFISNKGIDSSPPAAASLKLASTKPVRDWHVGQRLQVTVLTSSHRGQVHLQTANGIVEADTRVPLVAGQRLVLQVISTGEKPVLKVLDWAPIPLSNVLDVALRTLLPRQVGLPPLLANITEITLTTTGNQLSAPIFQAVKELFKRLPDWRQVSTAPGLKQALQDSGMFLEAKLAKWLRVQHRANLAEDFKAALLRLTHVLRKDGRPSETHMVLPNSKQTNQDHSAPPLRGVTPQPQSKVLPDISAQLPLEEINKALARQVEGVLARLQLNQIASAALEKAQALDWLLELPVRRNDHVDVIAIHIQEQKSKENGECVDRWTATLAFEFEALGPVHAKIVVYAQQITVDLWAERLATVDLFNDYFSVLNEFLIQEALTVTRFGCHHGRMPDPTQRNTRTMLVSTTV